MSNKIRSFLAIEVDSDLLKKIDSIEDDFKNIDADIKYVPTKNMHLTLKFFGNIDNNMVEDISCEINNIIKDYKPFDITIKGSGAFPNEDRIKVIWVGIEENPILEKLQKNLDQSFKKLGFKLEKNYTSHLTIGRMKTGKNKDKIQEKLKEYNEYDVGSMNVSKISLKKSTLTPNGPIYKNLKVFNL